MQEAIKKILGAKLTANDFIMTTSNPISLIAPVVEHNCNAMHSRVAKTGGQALLKQITASCPASIILPKKSRAIFYACIQKKKKKKQTRMVTTINV